MSPCQKNKVRVYVPYSTLIALTNEIRETPVDDLDDEDVEDILEQVNEINSSSIGANDVVICDTQVILRINPNADQDEKDHLILNVKTVVEFSGFLDEK